MEHAAIQRRYAQIRKILIVTLLLNWGVAVIKIVYGLLTHCTSITADGFHSFSDGTSNIIGLIGIHVACRPKDTNHPYGHRKYETFFSLAIAMLLFLLVMGLLHAAWGRIIRPVTPAVDARSFAVMMLTLCVNVIVMRYERARGKQLQSDILIADALHTKSDIFVSLSVIATLVAIRLGYPLLDPIATIVIALFIAHAGYEIVKQSSVVLCDTAISIDLAKLDGVIRGIPGVKTWHKIRTRGRPDDINIDLHVQVNPSMHMDHAHKISNALEEAIKKNFPEITDVVVHMEPLEKKWEI